MGLGVPSPGVCDRGARLVLAARAQSQLEDTAQAAHACSASTWILQVDVSEQQQVDAIVHQAVAQWGTIDILVNNAGIASPVGLLHDNDVAAWIRTINVNVLGTYLCCRAVLPIMRTQKRGKIANLAGAGATNAWASTYHSRRATLPEGVAPLGDSSTRPSD